MPELKTSSINHEPETLISSSIDYYFQPKHAYLSSDRDISLVSRTQLPEHKCSQQLPGSFHVVNETALLKGI